LQFDCSRDVNIVHARCSMLRDTDIAQTAPLLDLLQASHDRLYSRLFVS
jgi:urease accessory protein